MLYVVYGKDSIKSRKKLHELLSWAKEKRPEAEMFKITTENWSEAQFDELLVARGLFDEKYTVVLDSIFENKEIKSYVLDKVEEMASGEQLFFMIEKDVDSASLKKLEKFAKKVQEFAKAESSKPDFNIFSVANGLVERDKKKLWIT